MDIQVSSNFERLLFDAYDRDAGAVRALMGSLAQSRRFQVSSPALKQMRALFTADRADEQESAATIRAWMREARYCADPHTAVALAVASLRSGVVESSLPAMAWPLLGSMFMFRGPGGPKEPQSVPMLRWVGTYPLVDSLQSRLTVLQKTEF